MKPRNVQVFPSGELGIIWEDEHESVYPAKPIRCACRCAQCVNETTAEKRLDDSRVPEGIRALETHPIGNYGLNIVFSDGHSTGIYDHRWLRENCPCGKAH